MAETSIANAKNHLTRLIHETERGEHVHITRRGKAVAVLLSEDEYARFRQGQVPGNFWDLIVEMRSDPEFELSIGRRKKSIHGEIEDLNGISNGRNKVFARYEYPL